MTEKDEAVFAEAFEELAEEGYFTKLEAKFKPKTKTINVSNGSVRKRSRQESKFTSAYCFENRHWFNLGDSAGKDDRHIHVCRSYININQGRVIRIKFDKYDYGRLEYTAKRKGISSVSLLSQAIENIFKTGEEDGGELKSKIKFKRKHR